jgi:hypothetical protein
VGESLKHNVGLLTCLQVSGRVTIILKILITSTLALICLVCNVSGQGTNDRSKVLISFKSHGDHCFSLCVGAEDLTCCPVYSFTINGDGRVEYEGTVGVKVRGKKAHSVSAGQVAQLVAEFYKIDFFPSVIAMMITESTITIRLRSGSWLAKERKVFMWFTVSRMS